MTGEIVLAGLTLWGATGVSRSLLDVGQGIPVGSWPTYRDTQIWGILYLYDSIRVALPLRLRSFTLL